MRPVAKAHGASGLAEQPDTFIVIFLPPFDSFFFYYLAILSLGPAGPVISLSTLGGLRTVRWRARSLARS